MSEYRKQLNTDRLIREHRTAFSAMSDPRNRSIRHSLTDILMAGFAMFHLKYPSLLSFETSTTIETENLEHLYGLSTVCKDAQMRDVLDRVSPLPLARRMNQLIRQDLRKAGIHKDYAVLDNRLVLSLDGVEHFSSRHIKCDHCLTRKHSDGSERCTHQMLCGSIVHPSQSKVFCALAEPIIRADGATKNDCERAAIQRVLHKLPTDYEGFRFVIVADGLYSCGPVIESIARQGHKYIVVAKPRDHTSLFAHFEGRTRRKQTKIKQIKDKKGTHRYEWTSGLALNESWPQLRVTMVKYTHTSVKGKQTTYTWVTNQRVSANNVGVVVDIARSRWKIENETFNTLKNQGYQFAHNFGHGARHLSTVFAYLMLLAFLTDQLMEYCSERIQQIIQRTRTRVKFWEAQRAQFMAIRLLSFNQLYGRLVALYGVQVT